MSIQLIVKGAAGRMGKRVLNLAISDPDISLFAALEIKDHPDSGRDAGLLAGAEKSGVMISSECPAGADVMIDFSLPEAVNDTFELCSKNKCPLVLCTTGLSDADESRLNETAKMIPVLKASNMSVGMNMLFNLVGKVAALLGEPYDIEIVEAHHRFKKDSPSGTALTLAEMIAKETNRDYPGCLVHGREGKEALRQAGTIGMHAVRGGDIVGEHSVILSTLGETITLSHSAHSRDTFAAGAIRAAKWIANQKPGLYSMSDVLGL